EAEDRRERRAELVGDRLEERVLHVVEGLKALRRLLQALHLGLLRLLGLTDQAEEERREHAEESQPDGEGDRRRHQHEQLVASKRPQRGPGVSMASGGAVDEVMLEPL